MSRALFLFSHVAFQKLDLQPFPSVMLVQALKRVKSFASQGFSIPTYGFSGVVYCVQSHPSLSALMNFSNCRIMRPPKHFGIPTHS